MTGVSRSPVELARMALEHTYSAKKSLPTVRKDGWISGGTIGYSGTESVHALARALLAAEEALGNATVLYERAQFDAHDRDWARGINEQIRSALSVLRGSE